MRLKLCHHHGFTVSNLENSLKFYRDFLGLELVRISERKDLPSYDQIIGHADIHLHVGLLRHPDGTLLELFQYQNPKGRSRPLDNTFVGASHMAFEVEDIDALYNDMTAAGYGSINPPVDVERDGAVVARAMYALDPDGISLELFQEYSDLVAR
jgi:glyoxylase I family protein